ncbi:MAG: aldehyde dehydrogenase family protein [Armatimonadetes bacterium]|nr:MAG: aldehyde dehydrogenase family protein [Armatimonadota bacterium]
MLIGGEIVGADSGKYEDVTNPATGGGLGRVPVGDTADVDRAVTAATEAFGEWRDEAPLYRAAVLRQIADTLLENRDELSHLDSLDNGSPLHEMRNDIDIASYQLQYFAGLTLEVCGKTVPTVPGIHQYTSREPYGVVGRVVAFNHPLLFAASRIAAPLVVGNTVVLKPSEHTPLSTLRMGELLTDIIPPGVLNIVTGVGAVVGDALVRHPQVRRIGFTGSHSTGKKIQITAAESPVLTTVSLELGGKNPIIIFDDADLPAAVEGAIRGMNFTWQGQSCGSTSRAFVQRAIYDQFCNLVAERLDDMAVGNPLDEGSDTGVIAFAGHYDRVCGFIQRAIDDPEVTLRAGGLPSDENSEIRHWIRPTLFTTESDRAEVVREEVFGPVLVALPFDEYDEVIERANSTNYGLTASVWTSNLGVGLSAAKDIAAGYVWVNGSGAHVPGAPFGGYKDSGIGREEDIDELFSYTQLKSVVIRH